jgi:cobalt-zinc-cadmium efflux system protein
MRSPIPSDCDCCVPALDPTESRQKQRRLWIALGLIGGFALIEVAIAQFSHSLALLAESVHLIADCGALGLALLAGWMAQWGQSKRASFGYHRVEVLAALVNGLALAAIALWIGIEAIAHLQLPHPDLLSRPMLITAIAGFAINSLNASLLHQHSHHDLNMRGAFLHMVADAASALGVMVAAIAIGLWGWNWMDGAVSLGVAVIILLSAIPLIGQSLLILLDWVPTTVDIDGVRSQLLSMEGITHVQQLRVWAIAPGQVVLAAQLWVSLPEAKMRDRLICELQTMLHESFGIQQSYLQMTHPQVELPILSVPASLSDLVLSPPNLGQK